MTPTIIASIAGFFSAAIMSIIGHFLLLRKEEKIKLQVLKSKLHEEQLLAYKKLWSQLKPTSKFASDLTLIKYQHHNIYLNKEVVTKFLTSITNLFFSENGLFISRAVRGELFSLLDFLKQISSSPTDNDSELVKIDKQKESDIRQIVRNLIKNMRTDMGLIDVDFPKFNNRN